MFGKNENKIISNEYIAMDITSFADNLVLHLERDYMSCKAYTTEEPDVFKVVTGMSHMDGIVYTDKLNLKELKQLFVDKSVNGYSLKLNLVFKAGLFGIAKELAAEYQERKKREAEQTQSTESPNAE
jgi:hypothetical protein